MNSLNRQRSCAGVASDLPERMRDALDKLHDKWDEEDRDIDYEDPDKNKGL